MGVDCVVSMHVIAKWSEGLSPSLYVDVIYVLMTQVLARYLAAVFNSRINVQPRLTVGVSVQSETNWVCTSNTFSNLLSVGQYRKEVVLYVERYAASLQRDKSRHRDSLIKRHLPVAFWEINFWPKFGFSDFFNQILNSGMGKTFGTVIELRRR